MGYMGFGMQKWIMRLKPRQPYSRKGKSDGYSIERGHDIDLDRLYEVTYGKMIIDREMTPEYKAKLIENFRREKKLRRYKLVVTVLITALITASLILIALYINQNFQSWIPPADSDTTACTHPAEKFNIPIKTTVTMLL